MIKILIVEDTRKKADELTTKLSSRFGLLRNQVAVAIDSVSAKRELENCEYDLLLLDIQIPNHFPEPPRRLGGLDLLRDILRNKRYKLPAHIVGISAYDDILADATRELGSDLWGIVKYDESSDEWLTSIANKVDYLTRHKERNFLSPRKAYDYDFGVICALERDELGPVMDLLTKPEEVSIPNDSSTTYFSGTLSTPEKSRRAIVAATPQMGMPASSTLAMKMISAFTPKYLAMIGIAAGVRGEVNLGDILVADPTWDYGSGKWASEDGIAAFKPHPLQFRLDVDIAESAKRLARDEVSLQAIRVKWRGGNTPATTLSLKCGPFASGAAVLADKELLAGVLEQNRKLLGIDMETYGVFYAAAHCPHPRPKPLSIKSVSDFADEKKDDNFRHYAAFTAANAFFKIAMTLE